MLRIALTEVRKNPKIKECEPVSFIKSVVEAAQLGLEPGVQGDGYLIPYGRECQFQPGYRGLIKLARRSGDISVIDAQPVYRGDDFDVSLGTDPKLTHRPRFESTEALYYYAVCILKDGGKQFKVMSKAQVEKHRDQFSKQARGPAWTGSFDEMAQKTVLKRLCKVIPQSVELRDALQLEDDRYETVEAEFTDEQLKQNRAKTLAAAENAGSPNPDAEKLAASDRFDRLYETAMDMGINVEDVPVDVDNVPLDKIQAFSALLQDRIKQHG